MEFNSGSIVSALGAGAGVQSDKIVKQLVDIERQIKTQPIKTKRESYEAKISDFGTMRSALDKLKTAAAKLNDPKSFDARTASFSDSKAIVPEALKEGAASGTYTFEVRDIARSQSLSTTHSFADVKDEVGKGTLTISIGEWDSGVSPKPSPPQTFTANAGAESFDIEITDSNNSLEGLKNAINDAKKGVQASIINDGSGNRLVLTSESGAKQSIKIDVAETGDTPTNADNTGLSRFAFTEGGNQQLQQTQAGNDAKIVVNGLEVSRSKNKIDDIVQGFEFSVTKASPGEIMTVSIGDDKGIAEKAVRDFVTGFNDFLKEMKPLTGYNEETKKNGSLSNDSTVRTMITTLKGALGGQVKGLTDGFRSLSAIGVRTERDGTMKIDETTFKKAINENFDAVKDLFVPKTHSNTEGITVNGFGNLTQPGDYDVKITQHASKGNLVGTAANASLVTNLATAGATDYNFTVAVNGAVSDPISLTPGTYADNNAVAKHIEEQINQDPKIAAARGSVTVTWNNDHFEIESQRYGAVSAVSVTAVGSKAAELGLAGGTATSGTNVAGTVNGVEAFGSGKVLLPALKTPGAGLKMIVEPGATTSGTISFSEGFGKSFDKLMGRLLDKQGTVTNREKSLKDQLKGLDKKQEAVDAKIAAFEARLKRQYLAMDTLVNSLKKSGSIFENIGDRLPFTAKR